MQALAEQNILLSVKGKATEEQQLAAPARLFHRHARTPTPLVAQAFGTQIQIEDANSWRTFETTKTA